MARTQPIDAETPDLPEAAVDHYRGVFGELFAAFPERLRRQVVDRHFSPERLWTGFAEGTNVLTLFDELRGRPSLGMPMIILSAAGIDPTQTMFAAEDDIRARIAGSQRLYDAIASTSPQVEHRILTDASHVSLPLVRPDAVARAIEDVFTRT